MDHPLGGHHPGVAVEGGAQGLLDGVEVDAQAEDLAVAVAAPDHLEQAVDPAGEVTGPELGGDAAEREVGGRHGVAQHHVGPGVDQLADAGTVVHGLVEAQLAPGDGDADRARVVLGEVRRQPGHARGGLGGAVHHDEVPPAAAPEAAPAAYGVGVEAPAGLGHLPQAGEVAVLEAAGGQQVEGVRDAGEARGPGAGEEVPEALVDHAERGQHDAGARDEVGVQHRQAVAVVQRQRRDRAVVGGEAEVVGDGGGVGGHVVAREPHQLGRARRARGAQQQGQLGVQLVRGDVTAYVVGAAGRADDVGVVGRDHRGTLGLAPVGHDQRDVAVLERSEVGDERVEVVGALDQHQAAGRSPGLRPVGDASGEVGMAEHVVAVEDRRGVPEARVAQDLGGRRGGGQPRRGGREGHGSPADV